MTSPSATPTRKCSKGHAPVEAQLARYQSGEVVALSLTEPGTVYRLERTPSGWRCACRGYQFRGSCYHAAAALERFGVPCWHCAAVENVELYRNHWDGGNPIALCAPCAGH
jgi:SWIM zinc finger